MLTRFARMATTVALLAVLVGSPSIGLAQNAAQVPPPLPNPAPKPPLATETMLLTYDPLSFEQLVEIRGLLEQLVGALQKPQPPTPLPSPAPPPPAEVGPKK